MCENWVWFLGGGRGYGNPLQYSYLENPHRQMRLVGYSPRDCKQSGMTEWLSTGTHFSVKGVFLPILWAIRYDNMDLEVGQKKCIHLPLKCTFSYLNTDYTPAPNLRTEQFFPFFWKVRKSHFATQKTYEPSQPLVWCSSLCHPPDPCRSFQNFLEARTQPTRWCKEDAEVWIIFPCSSHFESSVWHLCVSFSSSESMLFSFLNEDMGENKTHFMLLESPVSLIYSFQSVTKI